MKQFQLLMIVFILSITNISHAQQKVYKCVLNGEVIYSNNEKDSKCKAIEMMELNKFSPSQKQSISNKDLPIKNQKQVKEETYPEPIPLGFVPEKPAPIDEKDEKKKFYQQKINGIEKSYLNLLGSLLKLRR